MIKKDFYKDINIKKHITFVNESARNKYEQKNPQYKVTESTFVNCSEDYIPFYREVWKSIPESYKCDIRNIQQIKALLCYYHSMTVLAKLNDDYSNVEILEDDNFYDDFVCGDPITEDANDFSNLGGYRRYYTAQEVIDGIKQKYNTIWGSKMPEFFVRRHGHMELILGAGEISHPENKEILSQILAKYNWAMTQFEKHWTKSKGLVYKIFCEPIDSPIDTEEIRSEHRFLFHITTKGSVNKIKKNGLIPFNDKNPDVKYPKPRVYFADTDVFDPVKQNQLLNCLKAHHKNDYFPVQFVLLTIDVVNIPEDVNFYYDLHNQLDGGKGFMGYATDSPIPAECIADIEDLGTCSDENKFQHFINKLPNVLKNIILKFK